MHPRVWGTNGGKSSLGTATKDIGTIRTLSQAASKTYTAKHIYLMKLRNRI